MQIPKLLNSKKIFQGRIFDIIIEEVEETSGKLHKPEIVSHPGGAVILPLLDNGNVIFIKQYRYPIKDFILELPAGKLDPKEDPLICAKRELREETGYEAEHIEKLASFYTTPGFCSEILHIFLATKLKKSSQGQSLEDGEQTITIHEISLTDAIKKIETGEIKDGKSIIGILLAEKKLNTAKK